MNIRAFMPSEEDWALVLGVIGGAGASSALDAGPGYCKNC